jgi:multiple sugar transport system ATP-binding protein
MADVKLNQVKKSYGNLNILHGIDLDIKSGEFIVFVGPSGCGKSTLLRSIAGLEEITSGELKIDGEVVNDVPPSKRGIAMVFQSYALYPHMTVYDNMAFSMKIGKESKAEIDKRVRQAAEILQLTKYLDRLPKAMSGGQRQRVAIGRAIVRNPKVFLFDEPLSNLDAALRVATRIEIAKLKESMPNTTMIYVTHDQVEAMTLADRIVVLAAGRIEQVGSPLELYEHPDNLFVAGFIGSPKMNFLAATIVGADASSAVVKLETGAEIRCEVDASRARAGEQVTLGVRPEHFEAAAPGAAANVIATSVTFVESLGSTTHAYCDYPGVAETLVCELDGATRLRNGAALSLAIPAARAYLFDAGGHAFRRHVAQAQQEAA